MIGLSPALLLFMILTELDIIFPDKDTASYLLIYLSLSLIILGGVRDLSNSSNKE